MLALGFIVFAAATAALVYVLQPETLRIAVGPLGSEDHQVVQAMAEAFEDESRTVRISPLCRPVVGLRAAGQDLQEKGRRQDR